MRKSVRAFGSAAGIVLAMAACNSEAIGGGLGGLAFEAAAVAAPPAHNVQVTAKITNISSGPVDVQYGGCVVTPVLHSGSLDGPVVYDPRPTQVCSAQSVTKTLDAGEAFTVQGSAVPNPPLAPGKYYVEAVISVNGEKVSVGAGAVTF